MTRASLATVDISEQAERAGAPAVLVALALMATPLLKPHGPAHVTPADVIMGLAVLSVVLWAGTAHIDLHVPYAVPMGLLIGTGILSATFSIVPMSGVIAVGQDLFLFSWGVAIANLIRSRRDLNLFLSAWALGAIAWATILLVAVFVGLPFIPASYGVRVQLWFDNPNMAGNYFMISLFVLMISEHPRSRLARLCGYALVGAAVLFTGSVAALGAFAIGAGVSLLYHVWRKASLRSAMAAGALGVALVATLAFIAIESGTVAAVSQSSNTLVEKSIGRASRSAEGRSNLFAHEFELFQTGPLIGRGPASTKANLARSYGDVVKEAHDDYLATLTERGVIGVVGLLILALGVGLRASAVSHRPLWPGYAAVIRNQSAFIGAAIALAVSAITHEILHYRHVWAFFGIVAGVYLFGLAREGAPNLSPRLAAPTPSPRLSATP